MSGERMESSLPIIAPWSEWRRPANADRRPACYAGGPRRSSVGLVLADGAAADGRRPRGLEPFVGLNPRLGEVEIRRGAAGRAGLVAGREERVVDLDRKKGHVHRVARRRVCRVIGSLSAVIPAAAKTRQS